MSIFSSESKRWALVCVTSMGVRLTPEGREQVASSTRFDLQATSAETNVLNISASLGLPCLALTRFVAGSPVAEFIRQQLRARNIRFEGAEVGQDGPWGFRHQFNIADSGFGLRGPRVWNDRAGEVGRTLSASDFDLERIFVREGASVLHLSGLVAALSPQATAACVAVAEYAKAHGTRISFDLNYRASFWKDREEELRAAFRRLAQLADVLMGNEEDFQLCLGFPGPQTGGTGLSGKIENFREMIGRVRAEYPQASVYATTLREVVSANEHLWGALLWSDSAWHIEQPRPVPVLDRIGGGDGFAGGLLYGLLRGWDAQRCLQFGWASGALAVSGRNDYAQPADEKQVWDIYKGNARVQR